MAAIAAVTAAASQERAHVPTTMRDYFFNDEHFKLNWENFEKVKEQVLSYAGDMWHKFSNNLKALNYEPLDKTKESTEVTMFPRHWMLPSFPGLQEQIKNLDMFKEEDNELIRFSETEDKLEVSLDTHLYRPSELFIHVEGDMVVITGKHEETSDNGRKVVCRQFHRAYKLPEGAKTENVVSNLSADGILVITATKPAIKMDQ